MTFRYPTTGTNKRLVLACSAVLASILLPSAAFAACTGNTNPNLVQNPSFELDPSGSTTITDWTVALADSHVAVTNSTAKGGAQSLEMGTEGGEDTIYQTIAGTQVGHVYTVCFYLHDTSSPGGATSFHARWNGEDQFALQHNSNLPFSYEAFNVVATGNDVLAFVARNDPSYFYIDSVIVQECTSCTLNPLRRTNLKAN